MRYIPGFLSLLSFVVCVIGPQYALWITMSPETFWQRLLVALFIGFPVGLVSLLAGLGSAIAIHDYLAPFFRQNY